uniref:Uncharacterized protein n=1 Tax=Anguilla anguilla TaxID=7936 RepID=A0A0E9W233_ANGAN
MALSTLKSGTKSALFFTWKW